MRNKIIRCAAVVFTAAFLLCDNVEASTVIVDAETGEKYENLDEALEHNVVSEGDINVSIPATKTESDTDYNKADHEDVTVTVQSASNSETTEYKVVDNNSSNDKTVKAESKSIYPAIVYVIAAICVFCGLAMVAKRLYTRRK